MKQTSINERVKGIDSIRFICAMVVVIDHYGVPFPQFMASMGPPFGKIFSGLIGCAFNGPAAVIVFFVISGFCIHFPYHERQSLDLPAYYSRRIIRICLPAFAAILLYKFLGLELEPPLYHVFWSIICELIYYILYPLFFLINNRVSFYKLTLLAYGIAFALPLFQLEVVKEAYGNYGAFGWGTWIIGLPCWLTGCWLAENYSRFSVLSSRSIWLLRIAIFGSSVLLKVIRFHVDSVFSSYVFTLSFFALLVCVWFGHEITYYKTRQPTTILERAGRWSYSLYMIHPVIPTLLVFIGLGHMTFVADQIVWMVFALLVSYIFFLLIEKPGHKLAVVVSSSLKSITILTVHKLPKILQQPT